jgi:hypothetical protein
VRVDRLADFPYRGSDLIEYLHANRHALVNYGQRRGRVAQSIGSIASAAF